MNCELPSLMFKYSSLLFAFSLKLSKTQLLNCSLDALCGLRNVIGIDVVFF